MRERRQTYRIRAASHGPTEALLVVDGREVPVDLQNESLEGFGVRATSELPVAEGDELHLWTPQGWFAVTVVRIGWNSDGSVDLGLRRGAAGRRQGAPLSRTTLLLAVAAGALIVPLLTLFLGRSASRNSPPRPVLQSAGEESVAVSPPLRKGLNEQ